EWKTFDEKFIRLDSNKLCELISAADSLKLRLLVDLTTSALARMIEGKTTEHITYCLLQEDKLEPLKIRSNDPCTGLLNRLYARKRKELKARKKFEGLDGWNVEIEEERVDDRSVDDLLLFINSGNKDSKVCQIEDCVSPTKLLKMLGSDFDFPADDFDDNLDPVLMKELNREVEELARRLNSVWPEGVQGITPFGQNRSIAPHDVTESGQMLSGVGLMWPIMMVVSSAFEAGATIIKESVFIDVVAHLKICSSHVPLYNLLEMGFELIIHLTLITAVGCVGSPLLPLLYIVNNIAFNISIINLVKISSAVVSSLAVVLSGSLSLSLNTHEKCVSVCALASLL
ncbi:SKP1-like protein 21 isoform X1, partial [Tanacetum coccineum]